MDTAELPVITTKKSLKDAINSYLADNPRNYSNIGQWTVSAVTNMDDLFLNLIKTEQDNEKLTHIGEWDVSNVTSMSKMFSGCSEFNQPLNKWNISKVRNFSGMFNRCSKYNQPLTSWTISATAGTNGMFYGATSMERANLPTNAPAPVREGERVVHSQAVVGHIHREFANLPIAQIVGIVSVNPITNVSWNSSDVFNSETIESYSDEEYLNKLEQILHNMVDITYTRNNTLSTYRTGNGAIPVTVNKRDMINGIDTIIHQMRNVRPMLIRNALGYIVQFVAEHIRAPVSSPLGQLNRQIGVKYIENYLIDFVYGCLTAQGTSTTIPIIVNPMTAETEDGTIAAISCPPGMYERVVTCLGGANPPEMDILSTSIHNKYVGLSNMIMGIMPITREMLISKLSNYYENLDEALFRSLARIPVEVRKRTLAFKILRELEMETSHKLTEDQRNLYNGILMEFSEVIVSDENLRAFMPIKKGGSGDSKVTAMIDGIVTSAMNRYINNIHPVCNMSRGGRNKKTKKRRSNRRKRSKSKSKKRVRKSSLFRKSLV